jgi:3-dehydroquinate dehydratase type I
MNTLRIAVPIIGPSMDDALADMDKAAELAVDIIELRLDCIINPGLERLLKHSKIPKIVTNRVKYEGGKFEGSETQRVAYLEQAIALGAEYVDMELKYFHPLNRPRNSTKLIVSYHNFEKTPEYLDRIYQMIADTNPDIVKIATKAKTHYDSLRMLDLVADAQLDIIGLCMGQEGVITRVYGPALGAYLTFASLPGKSSAPGQLTVQELRESWKRLQIE